MSQAMVGGSPSTFRTYSVSSRVLVCLRSTRPQLVRNWSAINWRAISHRITRQTVGLFRFRRPVRRAEFGSVCNGTHLSAN